jgi:hypothetical protein
VNTEGREAHHEGMWTGLLILVVLAAVVALGQWWVTRPSKTRPVDTARARAQIEAGYGKSNDIIRGQGLP